MLQMPETQRASKLAELEQKQAAIHEKLQATPKSNPSYRDLSRKYFSVLCKRNILQSKSNLSNNDARPAPIPIAVIGARTELSGVPAEALLEIQNALRIKNPKYLNLLKHGNGGHRFVDEYLEYFEELSSSVVFPRGFTRQALEILKKHGVQPEVQDNRRTLEPIELEFQGKLRPYQERAVQDVLKREFGVLSAATGSGKTIIALAVIAARRQPTLILVHTKELLDQWRDRIQSFLGIEAGVIGGGKYKIRLVTVGIINSVKKHLYNLPEHFGQVVVDECFPAGTTIMTCSGTKRIEQVKPGDIVKGYDHEKKMVVDSEVKHLFKRNSDSFCRICLTDGQVIICTPDHPFWVDNAYLPARKLKAGQTVWRLKNARIPDMLQGRHCKTFAQNSRGSGWCKSQWTASDNGSEENGMLERVGVESVALVEQANRGRPCGKHENGLVYNIETAAGNYFAEGILVHNCHRTPSAMFTDAVRAFDCKHMLGLSATAYRRDGLDPLIYWTLGEKVHQVDPRELKQIGAVLTPEIVRRETAFKYQYNDDYPRMISNLTQDRPRNEQIAWDVIRQAESRPGACLVVSDRVQHCNVLAGLLEGHNLSIRVLTGKTAAKDREAIVQAVQAGNVNVLVSTVQLLGEGFDCSGLSSLFLAAPMRFDGKITQVVGRILRPADGKRPVVFDYVDHNVGVLKGQSFHRARTLKELSA